MLRNIMQNRWTRTALFALLALCSASQAFAHANRTCDGNAIKWGSSSKAFYISTTSMPAGSSWDQRLQNAMYQWNDVKGSSFNFLVGRDTDGSHSSSNGKNEVYFESLDGGTLGVTYTRYHCYWLFGWRYGIDETDIGFDSSNRSWSTGTYDYNNIGGSPFNFESVALHEFGHSMGLLHEDRWMATMNSFYPNSGPLGYYKVWDPHGDDRQGARALYPDSTTEVDVAGAALKRTGSGSSGALSSPSWASDGSSVTIDFSFTNLSTSTQTFDIRFYLSTNTYISSFDTPLGTNYGAWASPSFSGTFSRTLTIPLGTAPGTYYIGYVIDYDNDLTEANETNNIQPLPQSITIF